ncbi:alpha/beta fold hydrolase [Kitasatospora sp. KL5]|uniref:alpha/beta fold hydrolase n=1 Tax=Kitasatospora sp. KL5 TaxID=3425125 RepID=UPI003D6F77C8
MTWTSHTVPREGMRLHCRDWGGDGPAVLLLHGLAGHCGEWDAVAARLSRRHRVVAVDLRGHGHSERRPKDVSRAAHVADVLAVADAFGLDRPVLVGQSLGGHTALLATAARPERIAGLVLVEAGPGAPDPGLPAMIGGWLDSWPLPFPDRPTAVAFLGGGAVGEGWAGGLEERDGGWWPQFDRDVMVATISAHTRSSWEEWERITCPTLLVLGQHGIIPADEITEMLTRRPHTTATSLPGTGHDVHLEQPDGLHRLLTDFLDAAHQQR